VELSYADVNFAQDARKLGWRVLDRAHIVASTAQEFVAAGLQPMPDFRLICFDGLHLTGHVLDTLTQMLLGMVLPASSS
jgi:hypothetical protein